MNLGVRRNISVATQGVRWRNLAIPDARFNWVPFVVQKKGRVFRPDPNWDITTVVSRSGGTYYVSKSGSDSTGDGSSGSPWASIPKAIVSVPANSLIHVGSGRYGWSDGGLKDATYNKSYSLVGDGDVVLDIYLSCTFSLSSGRTYTYQATQANPIQQVLDFGTLDSNGDPSRYSVQTSVDAVEANVGSWYQSGGVLYVHALDGGAPSSDIRPQYVASYVGKVTAGDCRIYIENIKTYCMNVTLATTGAHSGIYILNNCRIMWSNNTSLNITGYDAIIKNCTVVQTGDKAYDAILGNVSGGQVARIIEIDCTVYNIGSVAASSYNCSTNHNAGLNVILNGDYHDSYGPVISYIQSGAAWILGATAHNSITPNTSNNSNFVMFEDCWLDSCTSYGSTYDLGVDTGHTIYTRNFVGAGNNSVTGTIAPY